jgi:hypothetical protein
MVVMLATSTGLDSADVLAPIGVVCGAAIAAFATWFNARKSPADRLQALIDIYKDWPDTVPGRDHIAGLIRGQLGEIRHRYPRLDAKGAIHAESSDIDRAARRHLYLDIGAFLLSALAVFVSALIFWPIDRDIEIVVVSLISGFALFVAVTRGIRIVRHYF